MTKLPAWLPRQGKQILKYFVAHTEDDTKNSICNFHKNKTYVKFLFVKCCVFIQIVHWTKELWWYIDNEGHCSWIDRFHQDMSWFSIAVETCDKS